MRNIGGFSTYYPIFLTSTYGTPPFLIGIHLSSSSIIGAVAALYIGRGAENHSKAKLVAMGFILCSIAFALLALIRGYGIALMFPMIYGLGTAAPLQLSNNIVLDNSPPHRRGSANAITQTAFDLGKTVGPIGLGLLLLQVNNIESIFLVSAVIGLVVSLITWTLARFIPSQNHH